MQHVIPQQLYTLSKKLSAPLYIVGGFCRDELAGLKSDYCDWDICAPVSAEEFAARAEECGFETRAVFKNTGTVRLKCGDYDFEFTSFRSDKYVRGTHVPQEVFFTDDINIDARRRDFKCNAIYYDVAAGKFCDPLGGIEDIKARRITTVAEADKVFGEDGLRLMRLCRIAGQTGFTPSEECLNGARVNARLIEDIASERIWAELKATLCADTRYGIEGGQYAGLELLRETHVLKYILPELAAGDGMWQRKDYHNYDVLEHSFKCVLYAPLQIRLAALLHDVGKPYCFNNYGSFAGHEEEGERIARDICARLRVPVRLAERTAELTALHMYDLSGAASEHKVRKFIVSHYDVIEELLLLKQADYSACKDDLSAAPCVRKWRTIIADMRDAGTPFTVKELDVRGDELIAAGISPAETSKTLSYLLSQVAMCCVENEKQCLIRHALSFAREAGHK